MAGLYSFALYLSDPKSLVLLLHHRPIESSGKEDRTLLSELMKLTSSLELYPANRLRTYPR